MKDIVPENETALAPKNETLRKVRWPKSACCSVCKSTIWRRPIVLKEPQWTPEPRRTWMLCKSCHDALLLEMHRSTIRSPYRLRIALGMIASERAPEAYGISTHQRDQRRFLGIAWVLFIAMLFHLAIIIILVSMTPR